MSRNHPLVTLESMVLIALGGMIGANARYLVGLVVPGLGGTLVANVLGCFVLGFIAYETRYTGLLSKQSRLVLATGLLSSFTTYSTFALETVQSTPVVGVAYVVASYAFGFTAVLVGRTMAARTPPESGEPTESTVSTDVGE